MNVPHFHSIKILFLLLGILFAISTQATASSAAWLTEVAGKITYTTSLAKKSKTAKAFMGVSQETRFNLAEGSKLGIMYSGGRRESWMGPATVVIGKDKSSATDPSGKTLQVTSASKGNKPPAHVVQVSGALDKFRSGKIGGMRLRGGERGFFVPSKKLTAKEQDHVDQATQTYQQAIKTRSTQSDIAPEWTYISVLAEYEQFELMTDIVSDMKKRAPGDPVIAELHIWLTEG